MCLLVYTNKTDTETVANVVKRVLYVPKERRSGVEIVNFEQI